MHFAKRLLFCCRGIFQKAADMRFTFSFMKKCTVSVLAIHTVKTQRNRLRPQQIFFRLFLASEGKGSRALATFVACFSTSEISIHPDKAAPAILDLQV